MALVGVLLVFPAIIILPGFGLYIGYLLILFGFKPLVQNHLFWELSILFNGIFLIGAISIAAYSTITRSLTNESPLVFLILLWTALAVKLGTVAAGQALRDEQD